MFNIATNAYGRMSDLVRFTRKMKNLPYMIFSSGSVKGWPLLKQYGIV